MNIALWIVQGLMAALFIFAGGFRFTMPIDELEALTRDLGIGERVTFTGRLDETATLKAIARSDILVLASFMEGLPVVLMEAMALGVPVIASRVAGIPELVEHGKTGLLFDPANWAQLERAVERLCRDAELRGALAKDGRRRVAEEFSYPDAATPLIALFRGSADD